jgi:tetratricopeptide (TPR) repeat protein
MLADKTKYRYGRQIYLLKRIRNITAVLLIILAAAASVFFVLRVKKGGNNEKRELLQVWSEGDFEQAYKISKNALLEKPVDFFYLTVNGFSAYQLGISQINSYDKLQYIDECIFSLRKAMLQKEASSDGRVFYVLGKAYGYKGNEYADLAVKYLEMANNLSYEAGDIPEYLGLAYAAYGDYRNSVAAFSLAFSPEKEPSDNLLLSIARSYMAMEENDMAAVYLKRCIDASQDAKSIVVSRFMLAEIFKNSGEYDNAENQYLSIIDETGENAEVHYQLGELYSLKGDTTRARSEWRTANRQDPSHQRARTRLNI